MSAAPTSLLRRPLPAAAAVTADALSLARRIPLRVRLGVLVALLGLGGLYLWVRDSPLVAVKHVTVVGAHGPDAGAVRAALEDAAFDQTTLDLDPAALKRAVASYPLVKSLELHTHFPHGLTIVVESERPVAWISGGGRRVAVNATGKLLRGAFAAVALPTVPVSLEPVGGHVTDPRTLRALGALAEAPPVLAARVLRMRTITGFGLVAALRNGPQIRLGNTDRLGAKWLAAAAVLADPSSRGARYIDVRVPSRPAAGGVAPAGQADTPAPAVSTPAPATTAAVTPAVATPVTPAATTPVTPAAAVTTTPSVNP